MLKINQYFLELMLSPAQAATFPSNSGHLRAGTIFFGGYHRVKVAKVATGQKHQSWFIWDQGVFVMVFSQRKLLPKNLLFQKSMNSFRYDHCTDIRFSAAMAHNVRNHFTFQNRKTKLYIFIVWNPPNLPSIKLSALNGILPNSTTILLLFNEFKSWRNNHPDSFGRGKICGLG